MRNVMIIIKKQLKDTTKNKTILIQFLLYPVMALIMENAISIDGMQELFFTKLFSIMYMGMAPTTSIASIIAEEKEKNTLRVLMMANVKPWQYLLGAGIYVWTICMIGAGVMAASASRAVHMNSDEILFYLAIMGIGFVLSILAGACIGIFARNQMTATSIVMPCSVILSFVPMLAMFNDTIAYAAKVIYTEQLNRMLDVMDLQAVSTMGVMVTLLSAVILIAVFAVVYQRKGLD